MFAVMQPALRRGLAVVLTAAISFWTGALRAENVDSADVWLSTDPWISPSPGEAGRFLNQATFGSIADEAERIVRVASRGS